MSAIGRTERSLAQIVEAIRTDLGEGSILHLLALTYEFDPEQLVNFLFTRPLFASSRLLKPDMAEIGRIRPVVFYDAVKSRDTAALPPLLELHPWQSRAFGCHHSKAYLVVTERAVHLVLGSFNLTVQGLASNREVLGHFCWKAGDAAGSSALDLLVGFIAFLSSCLGRHVHDSEASALESIVACLRRRLEELAGQDAGENRREALVWSGYGAGQTGLERLRGLWDAWLPGREPDMLFAVSPFFDQNAKDPLARRFLERFPSLKRLVLATGDNFLPTLSKAHFSGFAEKALYAVPLKVGEGERRRIAEEASEEGSFLADDALLFRRLHAKVLMLASGDEGLVYAGSANFSCNAWTGRNQELGFAAMTASARRDREAILAGLFAVAGRDRFQELPDSPVAGAGDADDEEEAASPAYPGFIDYISLELEKEGGGAFFVLHPLAGSEGCWHEVLSRNYSVRWGGGHDAGGIAVSFAEHGRSQTVKDGAWQELLLKGRSLAFDHTASRCRFWVPYLYAGELAARRESLLALSSLDWLALFCSAGSSLRGMALPVFDPGPEDPGGVDWNIPQGTGPDRDRNPVVAMQSWLKVFGSAEGLLEERLAGILGSGRSTEDRVGHLVADFIRTLSRLVDCDRDREASGLDAWAFKTGETLQLARRLVQQCGGFPAEQALLASVAGELEAKLACTAPQEGSVLAKYLAFIKAGEAEDKESRP